MSDIKQLQKLIKYEFNNAGLLRRALTHPSYANERKISDNQRLEFLGDAVLELAITEILYKKFERLREGELSKMRSTLVNGSMLAELSGSIELGKYLRLSSGEQNHGGRTRTSTLADAFEALIGAIFLDGGFDKAKLFVRRMFKSAMNSQSTRKAYVNYKGRLQELAQKKFDAMPVYDILKEDGPEHNKHFTIQVQVGKKYRAVAEGATKKHAQQAAARQLLEQIKGEKL